MKRLALILLTLLLLITGISCDSSTSPKDTGKYTLSQQEQNDIDSIIDGIVDNFREELASNIPNKQEAEKERVIAQYGDLAFKLVFVSESGIMHESSICSGMKHSTVMYYYRAVENGHRRCGNCFRKIEEETSSVPESKARCSFFILNLPKCSKDIQYSAHFHERYRFS